MRNGSAADSEYFVEYEMPDDASTYLRWLEARDADAFQALARRHADLVIDIARRVGVDRGLAEDALQDALMALARDGTARPAAVGVRAWLARAALSRALNTRASERSRRRRERKVGQARAETTMSVDQGDVREAVTAALGRCGGEDAAVLSLRFIHGFEYPELASVLDVAEATARVRVHRALGRLREETRRDELDERALATFLTAVPPHTASAVAVEGAIASALAGMGVATALATAATVPTRIGVTLSRALGIAGAAVLVLGLGILVWQAATPGGPEDSTAPREASAPPPPAGATLRGRTGLPTDASTNTDTDPAPDDAPPGLAAKLPSPPRPAGTRPALTAAEQTPIQVRVDLVLADGNTEEILDYRVMHRGTIYEAAGLREQPDLLRTRPGASISVVAGDPRMALPTVTRRVPDPIPPLLVFRVPDMADPRLQTLTLEVVDAESGLPLPDAMLEWGSGSTSTRQPVDARGRIVDVQRSLRPSKFPALWQLQRAEWCVHAPGHRSAGWNHGLGLAEGLPAADADLVARWIETGLWRVALPLLPDEAGFEQRSVRVLDADGLPAADIFVEVVYPFEVERGIRAWPWDDGFRRTDHEGLCTFHIRDIVGLDIHVGGVTIAAWGLAKDAWPATGPREIRLPRLASAELVVQGVPDGLSGHWSSDLLGWKRMPSDGPAFPPTLDASVAQVLAKAGTLLPVWLRAAGGPLQTPRTTIRLPLIVGRAHTLHLYMVGHHRAWTVQPESEGPLQLTRRWEDLPLAR